MKQSPEISVKLSEDLLRRLLYISNAEGRTPNNQFLLMLRNYIAYFERTKGRISPADLAKINIDEYITPTIE
jgi:hypothetical protein